MDARNTSSASYSSAGQISLSNVPNFQSTLLVLIHNRWAYYFDIRKREASGFQLIYNDKLIKNRNGI